MKKSFRITKYHKVNKNSELISAPDEWTSFHDIGRKVSEKDYYEVENKYIDYILEVCKCIKVNELTISELEIYPDNCSYVEGDTISVKEVSEIVELILRESIWCRLISNRCEFHFGYDYYMYVVLSDGVESEQCIRNIVTDLNVEEYKSPYL